MKLGTIGKIEFILRTVSVESVAAGFTGLNDRNKGLEPFMQSFFSAVWNSKFPVPEAVLSNLPTIDIFTEDDNFAAQITTRNDFKTKCEGCIKDFVDRQLYQSHKKLIIVFFRNLLPNEIKIKSDILSKSKYDLFDIFIYGIGDLLRLVTNSGLEVLEKVYQICQMHYPFYFDKIQYENKPQDVCPDFIARSVRESDSGANERHTLKEIILQKDRIMLLSDAAFGKTEELKSLHNSLMEEGFFVFFFRLKDYNGKSIDELLPPNFTFFSQAALFFDAYDEIEAQFVSNFNQELNIYSNKYPNGKIIVSSRLNFYDKNAANGDELFKNFKNFQLTELTDADIASYFQEKLNLNAQKGLQSCRDNGIYDLLYNPFYLVNVVKSISANRKFVNKTELMHNLFDLAFDHKKIKVAKSSLLNKLSSLALDLIKKGKSTISQEEILQTDLDSIKFFSWITTERGEIGFIHNNYKEFLAAFELSKLNLDTLKSIICIKIIDTYIRPQYFNTLGFLIELKSQDFRLRKFLLKCGKSFVVYIERMQLEHDDKLQLLRSIFEEYDAKKSWMSAALYDDEKIARLCDSSEAVEFLISRLDKKYFRTTIISAIETLGYCKQLYGKEDKIREIVLSSLNDADTLTDDYLVHHFIRSIEAFRPSLDTVKELYQRFSLHPKSCVRASANYLLYHFKLGDYFVEELYKGKERTKLRARFMTDHDNADDISDAGEHYYIISAMKEMTNQDALAKLGFLLIERERNYNYTTFIEDYFETIEKFDNFNKNLTKMLYEMFLTALQHFSYETTNRTIRLIKKHGLERQFIHDLIQSKFNSYIIVEGITYIYGHESEPELIEFLNKDGIEHKDQFITILSQRFIDWKITQQHLTEKGIECNIIVNTSNERYQKFLQQSFDKLFNKSDILCEVKRVLQSAGKTSLNWEELCSLKFEIEERIPQFVRHCFASRTKQQISLADIELFINEDWQIGHIYRLLHEEKNGLIVSEPQKKFIIDWCLNKIKVIDFITVIQYKENGYDITVHEDAIWCEFFIRKLDIPIERELYIRLVCFEWHDRSISDFSRLAWIESKVGSEELRKALDKFINNQTLKGYILSNRLNYCIEKGWDIGLSRVMWAMEYFGADQEVHHVMIKYMSEFGHLNDLLSFYSKFDQSFKLYLIETFAKQNLSGLTKYVEEDILRNDENSIRLADQLMLLGSNIALIYYIKWVKKNKKFFKDDSHREYNVGENYNIKHLKHLITLMGLTYRYPSKHDFGRGTIEAALTGIAMKSVKNVKMVIKRLTSYIRHSRLQNINYLHYYLDQLILKYMQSSNVI